MEGVQEAVSPRWLEVGEMWKNCATLHNILQLKRAKRQEPTQLGRASPDMHILLTVLYTILMKLVKRICQNIKTSYPEWSLALFSSLECLNK